MSVSSLTGQQNKWTQTSTPIEFVFIFASLRDGVRRSMLLKPGLPYTPKQWSSIFPMLWSLNIVPQMWWPPTIKLLLLLLPKRSFDTVLNCNLIRDPQRDHDPQVENCCLKGSFLPSPGPTFPTRWGNHKATVVGPNGCPLSTPSSIQAKLTSQTDTDLS